MFLFLCFACQRGRPYIHGQVGLLPQPPPGRQAKASVWPSQGKKERPTATTTTRKERVGNEQRQEREPQTYRLVCFLFYFGEAGFNRVRSTGGAGSAKASDECGWAGGGLALKEDRRIRDRKGAGYACFPGREGPGGEEKRKPGGRRKGGGGRRKGKSFWSEEKAFRTLAAF